MKILQNLFKKNEKAKLIDQLPLLRLLDQQEKNVLQNFLHQREFAKGEILFTAQDPAAAAYFVVKGSVGIYQGNEATQQNRIQLVRPGEILGYSAFFSDKPRSATAAALENTVCLAILRKEFTDLCSQRPKCALKILLSLYDVLYHHDLAELREKYNQLTQQLAKANIIV
jgi:CRP/FNR family cyclic AMP-dependent transcriptional regulator